MTNKEVVMKYLLLVMSVMIGISMAATARAADSESAQQKQWTEQYQYGLNETDQKPKTGKPSENGEFEIAPKE